MKDNQVIDGSALRALKYPFDRFYFFEKDVGYFSALQIKVSSDYPEKLSRVIIENDDCNSLLNSIDEAPWASQQWRGVIFLDPFAMDLAWSSLERISNTRVFDVWYLFPLTAVTRNLPNNGKIPPAWEVNLTKIFGSPDWKQYIYQEASQLSLFEEESLVKIPNGLINYTLLRLKETFPTVAPNPYILRTARRVPLFLLCFAGSNPSEKAKRLSLNIANHILENME